MSIFETLNDDVLGFILLLVYPRDALHLSMTCRAAYTYALPRALSEVVLFGPTHLAAFCCFLSAKLTGRAQHLRALTIHARRPKSSDDCVVLNDTSDSDSMCRVLSHAVNLRLVAIHDAEDLALSTPALFDGLSSLSGLIDVSFYKAGIRTLEFMTKWSSRPRRVKIHTSSGSANVELLTLDRIPWDYLPRSVEALSLVDGHSLSLKLGMSPRDWPLTRSLELGGIMHIYALSLAFPNVAHLRILLGFQFVPSGIPGLLAGEMEDLRFLQLMLVHEGQIRLEATQCHVMGFLSDTQLSYVSVFSGAPLIGLAISVNGYAINVSPPEVQSLASAIAAIFPNIQSSRSQKEGGFIVNCLTPLDPDDAVGSLSVEQLPNGHD
ncbi:hypothetical protein IEO21_05988 [Rhodonia placenta]|uniref:F-box domain-containing protein n=1 Tax=Rhodonia placenta TaxID=104341 RepID=A0A8H7U115_9APHY|nr:hypothetical protein IEO21_05988 [Postia placenta]